jgi:DNA polymerase III epsilon subunit-like protein
MTNTAKTLVFLDCETSGVNNGREPACRYYLNGCIEGAVKAAEAAGRDGAAAKLACIDGILRGVFESVLAGSAGSALEAGDKARLEASFRRIVQDFIPAGGVNNAHLKRFVYMPFDEAFGQFWRQTEHIRLVSTEKVYRELYRDAFTKQALGELCKTTPWTFLRGGGGALHFCYDESCLAGGELLAFDPEQKAHVDAVARACFGPAVLSICMLEAEVRDGGMVIEKEPYYQVFRQHGRYVHSLYAETAHKLSVGEVQAGVGITSLHTRLWDMVNREEDLTFVAHNAVKDRQWIIQSIENQIKYLEYTDCKEGGTEVAGGIADLHALMDRLKKSQWFCTQHGDLDAAGGARSRNGALVKIMDNRGDSLHSVYEKVTGRALQGQHDARVDTYACALIFCRLLLLNHGINVEASGGYAKLQAMLEGVQDAREGVQVVRKTQGSSMETLLSRIMKILHEV